MPKRSAARKSHRRPAPTATGNAANVNVILAALLSQAHTAQKVAYEAWRKDAFKRFGISEAEAKALTSEQLEARLRKALAALSPSEYERLVATGLALVSPAERQEVIDDLKAYLEAERLRLINDPERLAAFLLEEDAAAELSPSVPTPTLPTIEATKPPDRERRRMLDYEKSFIQDGVRYFPLSAAAPVIQAPASTLLHWIKKETKFDGEPLQGYYFAPANQYFISEESIDRATNRFINWPSQEPAGPVTLGEQRDQSGYIGLTDAAQTLGVDHHTMWRWTTKGTAPIDELDVIKCPASDQYYIRQKDVAALKKYVPRSGLRAGRRPQPGTLQPR